MNLKTYLMIKQAIYSMPGPTQYVPGSNKDTSNHTSSTLSRSVLNKGISPISPILGNRWAYSPKTIDLMVNSFIPGDSDYDLLHKEVLAKTLARRKL